MAVSVSALIAEPRVVAEAMLLPAAVRRAKKEGDAKH